MRCAGLFVSLARSDAAAGDATIVMTKPSGIGKLRAANACACIVAGGPKESQPEQCEHHA